MQSPHSRRSDFLVQAGASGLVLTWLSATVAPAEAAQLPIACVAGACGTSVTGWLGSGTATAVTSGNTLTINQTSNQAILNWQSFNVSADGQVTFNQPGASSVALNKIFQASPSQIFGQVTANGQIYLVNQNGFVFGKTAKVNVGGLLASTLDISTQTFTNGLLAAMNDPRKDTHNAAASSDGRTGQEDASGNPIMGPDGKPLPISIDIQQGATISTQAPNQRLMFAGRQVNNSGTLSAPDGQIVLAAGQKLYLTGSSDPNLRGLVVEVDGDAGSSTTVANTVTNTVTGNISSDRGNVTLVGLAVNQQGRISATTSVQQNGSIYLLARGGVSIQTPHGFNVPVPQQGGKLTLGPSSSTTILPDPTDTSTAVDAQAQLPSTLRFDGQQVDLAGGSSVIAPGGQLTVTANSNPDRTQLTNPIQPDPSAHLRVDAGAVIDLSGSTATVPITRNLVTAQLRANELADDPLQRNGPLHGQTVVVDARADGGAGTPLANVSGEIALTQRGILERTSNGGSATFDSLGDVVFAPGASINVSGGQVDYTGGLMQTTKLVGPGGKLIDIGQASPNVFYSGILNPQFTTTSDRWGVIQVIPTPGIAAYEPGYVQGASAGSVSFLGSSMVLAGDLTGHSVNGPYQRTTNIAVGGQLTIGAPGAIEGNLRAPALQIVNQAAPVVVGEDASLPPDLTVSVTPAFITQGGFSSLQVASNDLISIAPGVSLSMPTGGSVSLTAPRIVDQGTLSAPAGTVTLQSPLQSAAVTTVPLIGPSYGIFLGEGATIDVSGEWINDYVLPLGTTPTGLALANGGSVTLSQRIPGGTLQLGSGVQLHASGGAWIKQSGSITGGKGGSLSILDGFLSFGTQTTQFQGATGSFQAGSGITIDAFGVEGAAGGRFSLIAPRIEIASGNSSWLPAQAVSDDLSSQSALSLDSSLFSSFGFASFSLTANAPKLLTDTSKSILTVDPNTSIDLHALTLMLSQSAVQSATASTLRVGVRQVLPDYRSLPSALSLSSLSEENALSSVDPKTLAAGDLSVDRGTRIVAAPGSAVTLSSSGDLLMDGTISLPAGQVALNIAQPVGFIPLTYLQDPSIELGAHSLIDVSGEAIYQPSDSGALIGKVLSGGTVSIKAFSGSVIADAGSVIDFSGTAAPLSLPTGPNQALQVSSVASNAGSLSVQAVDSISLLGDLQGHAGVGDTGAAAGGSLTVALTSPIGNEGPVPRTVLLEPDDGGKIQAAASMQAVISTNRLATSGIDQLTVMSDDRVEFMPGVQLSLGRAFIAQTPVLGTLNGATANVSAPYIVLGTAQPAVKPGVATSGYGSLNLTANVMELNGYIAFQGVSQVILASSGDLQLIGSAQQNNTFMGGLSIAGDLTLLATRIYPTTLTSFSISAASGPENTIRIESSGASPGTPLSAGGSLTLTADDIEQSGTLLAPFGSITLQARNALNLNGGLISVSGDGTTIPFGRVDNGTDWDYAFFGQLNPTTITSIPQRSISLQSLNVTIGSTATLDVSGGGDLYAYSFTPGTGGTQDFLSGSVTPGLYAILPSLTASVAAPYDPMLWADSGLKAGQSIYLSGGGGLAAGTYLLLPARYGLLPGAYFISSDSGFANLQPGMIATASDGSPVVAGRMMFGNTGIGATLYSGYDVRPGSYGRTLAAYTDNLASQFFSSAADVTATPPVPGAQVADGGTLEIAVQNSLTALGKLLAKASSGSGEGGEVAITAPTLEIDPSVREANSLANGVVHIGSDVLTAWAPGRLVLGGELSIPSTVPGGSTGQAGATVKVASDVVHFTAGAAVSADEVIVAARQAIAVDSLASLSTHSLKGAVPQAANFTQPTSLSLQGTGASGAALLAVSDFEDLQVTRPASSTAGSAGYISVGTGATVGSRGAIVVDSTGSASIADSTLSGPGAHWTLGANRIAFGPNGSAPDGLAIDPSLLASLNGAGTVRITSATSIDVNEPVALGVAPGGVTPTLAGLTLQAGAINNLLPGATTAFGAQKLTLSGTSSSCSGTPGACASTLSADTGTLQLTAGELDLGAGSMTLLGVDSVAMNASTAIVGTGNGQFSAGSNLTKLAITAPLVTVNANSQTQLLAPNAALVFAPTAAPQAGGVPLQTGGSFVASAQSISDGGIFLLPSGQLNLSAAGALTLTSGAVVDTSGISPTTALHGSNGGQIVLSAGSDLSVQGGTRLDVSPGDNAVAGSIVLSAGGTAGIAGNLIANGRPATTGGTFSVLARTLNDFAGLNRTLEQGGFTAERDFEVTSGSLLLAAGDSLTAEHVKLLADAGSVDIAGTVNASAGGGERGSIEIAGATGVDIHPSASLLASGLDNTTRGGTILLSSSGGPVVVEGGATLAASGMGAGRLILRAPLSGTDVQIYASGVSGSRVDSIIFEPWLPFTLSSGSPSSDDLDSIASQVMTTMGTVAPSLIARLPKGTLPANATIEPFVDMMFNGDLTLSSYDFSGSGTFSFSTPGTWRFGSNNAPADIAFRATGNLTVNGTLTDGFVNMGDPSAPSPTDYLDLGMDRSSSFTLVAGANLTAGSATATAAGSAVDLTLDSNSILRTGTGDITLVAARNVTFQPGVSVYTGGVAPAAAPTQVLGTTLLGQEISVAQSYPEHGGSVSIIAGGNIASASQPAPAAVGDWQPRWFDSPGAPGYWGIDFQHFDFNVGALGGGDVSLIAAGNVVNIDAATSDSRYIDPTTHVATAVGGGGNLRVTAGGDVGSALLYVASGTGRITAGGTLSQTRSTSAGVPIGSLLLADDTRYYVAARGDIYIEGELAASQMGESSRVNLNGTYLTGLPPDAYFYRFQPDSLLQITSNGGTIALGRSNAPNAITLVPFVGASTPIDNGTYFPASVDLDAYALDVNLQRSMQLVPSDRGELSVYAGRDLFGGFLGILPGSYLLASADSPIGPGGTPPNNGPPVPTHVGDTMPVMVTAGRDISGVTVSAPKAVEVSAGRNITDVSLQVEMTDSNAISSMTAGGDVTYNAAGAQGAINISGPGKFELVAGGNVDLGFSNGISTYGNLHDPALPSGGADILVLAGLGAPLGIEPPNSAGVQDFLGTIVAPSEQYQGQLVSYVEQVTGRAGLTASAAMNDLRGLSLTQQLPFLQSVLFSELVEAGRLANTVPGSNFARGYAAIDALFPGSRPAAGASSPYKGDITMPFSRIYTLQGGSISLLAPGGLVDVGQANPPPDLQALGGVNRGPSGLGIVTAEGGDVDIFTQGDVLVNASRVFTLGGGDIAIWSTLGNIDAGRGAKTAISAPPPVIGVDSNGNVQIDFSAAVAGSGIRTIQTNDTVAPGNVDLIAPAGFVNAGDAGIGSSGNLNVAAQHVLGLDNIQVQGVSTGVPPEVSGIGASLSGAAASSAGTQKSAADSLQSTAPGANSSAPLASSALSWLDVFVEGFGKEVCKSTDLECLKRQSASTP
jgi:filamentous hemagglutinin family protein